MAVNASSFEDEKPGGIQVIARAAAILNVLGKHPGGMSLGEIAQEVALPRSTVQRIVAALDSAQLVRSSGAGGLRLGPALLKLISSVHSDVVDLVRPFLEQLSANVNETVTLHVPVVPNWPSSTTSSHHVNYVLYLVLDLICRSTALPAVVCYWLWKVMKMSAYWQATPMKISPE